MGNSPAMTWDQFPIEGQSTSIKSMPLVSPAELPTGAPLSWDSFPIEGSSRQAAETTQEVANPDESTIGKVWDWVNKPLIDLHSAWGTREGAGAVETGVESGLESFASGLTSPLSLGLMLVTGGMAGLARGAAVTAGTEAAEAAGWGAKSIAATLDSLGMDVKTATTVSKASDTISKLMHFGFTGQQIYSVVQAVPHAADAIKEGNTEAATEYITHAVLNGMAAAASTKAFVGRIVGGESNIPREAIWAHQHIKEHYNGLQEEFQDGHLGILRDKSLDMATRLYHEAGRDIGKLEQWRREVLDDKDIPERLKIKYDGFLTQAQNLPEDAKILSNILTTKYAELGERGKNIGFFNPESKLRDNYAGTHRYVADDAEASNVIPRSSPGSKNPAFTKSRSFDSLVDALKKGFVSDEGLASAYMRYLKDFGDGEGLRAAEDQLRNTKASDGMPIGVNPAAVRSIKDVSGKIIRAVPMRAGLDFETLNDASRIFEGKDGGRYLDVSDYRPGPDKFALYRVREVVPDPEGGERPIFDRANLLIHPDSVDAVQRAFQDTSWFRQNKFASLILKGSTEAKQLLLSFSPFHWLTVGLRGIQMGMNPWEAIHPPKIDIDGLAMAEGTKHGLTLWGNKNYGSEFQEGVVSSHFIGRIPGLGPLWEKASKNLFGNYIPRLKASVFENVSKQISKRHPTWAEGEVYTRAATITNGAFGGVNWRQLGVSMGSQDALRLAFLAPDFTGSQLFFARAGFQPGGSVVWQSMATVAIYNALVAQILNALTTGEIHMDHPFSVQSPDGKKSYSVRTMPSDLWHALTDPRGFISNRLNPVTVRPAMEFLTGRNQSGRTASYDQQVSDFFKNVFPIPAQGLLFSRPDQTPFSQFIKGWGIQQMPNRSVAETLAIQKASSRGESGAIPDGQMRQHQYVGDRIDKLRAGEITASDIRDDVQTGRMSQPQAIRVIKEAALSPLVARVTFLPLNDALDVYGVATDDEKRMLFPVIKLKYDRYRLTETRNRTADQNNYMAYKVLTILQPPEER